MKLVTQTEGLSSRFGDKAAVEYLCKAGFDGIDMSMFEMKNNPNCIFNSKDYKKYALLLKKTAQNYGVTFEQSHAPFPSAKEKDDEYNDFILEKLKRSIEIAGLLEAKIIVVHPVFFHKHKFEKNMELYHTLEPYAADYGVKIALENMWGRNKKKKIIPNVCSLSGEFNEYVDALDSKHFTACLDLGHCGLVGSDAATMIREMGSERLGCLHIHDNDFISDSHTLPYLSDMNWNEILKALGETGYKGNFTFEADNFLKKFPAELLPSALNMLHDTGRFMMKEIERYGKV